MIPLWILPGVISATLIVSIAIATLYSLLHYASLQEAIALWHNDYLWHVVRFTLLQAFLSTLLAVLPAILLARALYRRHFPGRKLLLRFCSMTVMLPVLVAIFGLVSVYGRQGWLAQLCAWLGIPYTVSLYGINGILLAHVFFNLPLATRLLLQSLEQIAVEQRQLAAQLDMTTWQFFRWLEWPAMQRAFFSAISLIFMLCFASFTVVLALGGGPKATTIEVAIYQALNYDFNLGQGALLALIQLICCLTLLLSSQALKKYSPINHTLNACWINPADSYLSRISDFLLIGLKILLISPPLIAVIINGLNASLITSILQTPLWQAFYNSIRISLLSGILCLLFTFSLLWTTRELQLRRYWSYSHKLELCGILILSMPSIVIATGFFLLLNNTIGINNRVILWVIVLINALSALPYSLRILDIPMYQLGYRYNQLIASLGMNYWDRLSVIELKALKRPLCQAFAFACLLSMGDFGAIALFGSTDFATLPYYLYQQLGAYRVQDSAVTALILLLICFGLFTLLEKFTGRYD